VKYVFLIKLSGNKWEVGHGNSSDPSRGIDVVETGLSASAALNLGISMVGRFGADLVMLEKQGDRYKAAATVRRRKFADTTDVFIPSKSLGISRAQMPQIKSTLVPDFIKWLQDSGIRVTRRTITAKDLKPTQREVNLAKVRKLADPSNLNHLRKPVIISKDDYLLDGHHRWMALITLDEDATIPTVQVGLKIRDLLARAHQFGGVKYKELSAAVNRPELFMRREKDAIDLFAAFIGANSMDATESNFAKLRKKVSQAEKRIMKEVRMKKMQGVSVGKHPYFQQRGSFDGEKMVVALRISFDNKGSEHMDAIENFAKRLGFTDKAMTIASDIEGRGTNNRGRIEELDNHRPVTHSDMSDVVKRKVAVEIIRVARVLAGAEMTLEELAKRRGRDPKVVLAEEKLIVEVHGKFLRKGGYRKRNLCEVLIGSRSGRPVGTLWDVGKNFVWVRGIDRPFIEEVVSKR